MPKYIIEREIPGAGAMTPDEIRNVACTSNGVLGTLNVPYTWVQSFVTGDKIYCIHIAPDEATVHEHARRGGFPIHRIEKVHTMMDPASGE